MMAQPLRDKCEFHEFKLNNAILRIFSEIGIEESSWANCYISLSLVTVVFLSLALKGA